MLVVAGTIRLDPAKVDEAAPATAEVTKATRAQAGLGIQEVKIQRYEVSSVGPPGDSP